MTVPTATMLVAYAPGSSKFLTFTSPVKHGGRKIVPGGKLAPVPVPDGDNVSWRYERPILCATRELPEETGLSWMGEPSLFGVRTDPHVDVRFVKLKKASDDTCDASVAGLDVQACFGCPDSIFLGVGVGETRSDGLESGEFIWIDVAEEIVPDEFAAGHDVLLLALSRWWKTGGWNGGTLPSVEECTDFTAFREKLLAS